jgi:hypothetical protein
VQIAVARNPWIGLFIAGIEDGVGFLKLRVKIDAPGRYLTRVDKVVER